MNTKETLSEKHILINQSLLIWPLIGIFSVLFIYLIRDAKTVLVPLIIALILKIALDPLVKKAEILNIPRPLAALLIMTVIIGSTVLGLSALYKPATQWLEKAPSEIRELRYKTMGIRSQAKSVAETKAKVEKIADDLSASAGLNSTKKIVVAELDSDSSGEILLSTLSSTGITLVFLTFFLVNGRTPIIGWLFIVSDFSARRKILRIAQHINQDITAFLQRILFINFCLGIAVAIAMYLLGMPNPLLWGAVAMLFNFIPYLGSVITGFILLAVASITFDGGWQILYPALVFAVLSIVEGQVITPYFHANKMALNPAVILIFITAFYWVWGIAGILLAVPMLAMLRITIATLAAESGLKLTGKNPA